MKKFRYSLETVLSYKQQILDRLKEEYALRMQAVREKEEEIAEHRRKQRSYEMEFDGLKIRGGSIENMMIYVRVIERMEERIKEELLELEKLKELAEQKKAEVIEANVDVNKFEKLKEKKLEEYRYFEQKEQENFIEEFVGHAKRA